MTSFDDLPNPAGTCNGSYTCEFGVFQWELAAEFLMWQSSIVREYKRPDQFITQNFDYEWLSIVPLILHSAMASEGETIRFLLNYSSEPISIPSQWSGTDLLSGTTYTPGQEITLPDWGVKIICCSDK